MKCFCNQGYKGEFCQEKICQKPCQNKGKCVDGVCFCELGFSGISCENSKLINKSY